MTQYNVINAGLLASGQPEDISQVLANFNAIKAIINALKDDNIDPAAAIAIAKLAGYPADATKALFGDGTWKVTGLGQAAHVSNSVDINAVNNTITFLTFDTERFDTDTIHDPATNPGRLTCKTAGKYLVIGQVTWAAAAGGSRYTYLRKNGTDYIARVSQPPVVGDKTEQVVSTLVDLVVTDYLELGAIQDSGGTVAVSALFAYSPEFSMVRVG